MINVKICQIMRMIQLTGAGMSNSYLTAKSCTTAANTNTRQLPIMNCFWMVTPSIWTTFCHSVTCMIWFYGLDSWPVCLKSALHWLSEDIFIIFLKQWSCLGCKWSGSKSKTLSLKTFVLGYCFENPIFWQKFKHTHTLSI